MLVLLSVQAILTNEVHGLLAYLCTNNTNYLYTSYVLISSFKEILL